jgi:hypothetical protein
MVVTTGPYTSGRLNLCSTSPTARSQAAARPRRSWTADLGVHRRPGRANLSRGLQIIDEAVRLADQSPQRRGHRYPLHLVRGSILMELDRLHDARSTLQTGTRISEELGVRWRLPLYQAFLAMEYFLAGEWDDAIAEFEAALALTEETGERYSLVIAHSIKALIALHRGDLRHAGEAAARPSASSPTPAPVTAATGRCGRAPCCWRPPAPPRRRSPRWPASGTCAPAPACGRLPGARGRPDPPVARRRRPVAGAAGGGRGRRGGGTKRRPLTRWRRLALPGTGR